MWRKRPDELTFTVELEDIEKQVLMVSMGGDEVKPSNRKRADRTDEQRYEVELEDGANTIDLMVTSEDDEEQSYQLIVRRDARSSDATLGSLILSEGALSPAFDMATTSYKAKVGHAVEEVTVTATKNDDGATVVQSPDNPVALTEGAATRITVTVTAEDGTTTKAYMVTVERDGPGVSSNADLSRLTLSEGELDPDFDPAMLEYEASVGNAVEEVTVTATKNHPRASVAYDPGSTVDLDVGVATAITVTVTAEDGTTTKAYKVTVTREELGVSSNADLSGLSLSPGALNETFDAAKLEYTASVGNAVEEVTVTATKSHSSATVAYDPGSTVALTAGRRQRDHGDGHRRGRNHEEGV